MRRQAQLRHMRRDLDVRDLRGNVDTRLRKVESGEYEAILLAKAGLDRLGLGQRITEIGIEALAFYIAPFEPEARKQGANVKPIVPEHGLVFTPQYLNTRAATIYGGSSEVQRNIMSKLILGF